MNHEAPVSYPQAIYLLKILAGLAVLAMVVVTALWFPLSGASPDQLRWGLGLLLVLAVALIPLVRLVYHRMDELQKLLHKKASMSSLSLLVSMSCAIGILQASRLVPLFNQFWTLGFIVMVWGVNLMLANRRFQ